MAAAKQVVLGVEVGTEFGGSQNVRPTILKLAMNTLLIEQNPVQTLLGVTPIEHKDIYFQVDMQGWGKACNPCFPEQSH